MGKVSEEVFGSAGSIACFAAGDYVTMPTIEQSELKSLIRTSLERGESSDCGTCEVLKARSGGRGMLMRVRDQNGRSVIAKAWALRELKDRLKSATGQSMAKREWAAHRYLEQSGVAVPRLLKFLRIRCRDGQRYEVIVVEDLGSTRNGLVHLKELLSTGNESRVRQFEDAVISITTAILQIQIIDVDHQLRNIVLNGSDQPIRIDFECASRFRSAHPPAREFGIMLGRLIVSHAFGTQPDLARTTAFAHRLADQVSAPHEVRRGAANHVVWALEKQRRASGVDSRLELGW